MFRSPSTLVLLLLLALLPGLALAQNTGKLAGQVTDATTGEPLVGANVFLPEIQRGAAADIDGNYTILGIPVGTYTVRFSFAGLQTKEITGVEISSGSTRTLDAALQSGDGGIALEVVYERPLIQNDAIGVPKVVTGEDIQNLPVRGVQSVAAIQAGVVTNDGSGTINARGGRGEEVTYFVDGVKVIGSQAVPQQAIAEQQMLIGTIPPQYGDVTGAVISVSTRSGGNDFFGSAEAITSEGLDGFGYNLGSLTLGGPIVPNFASFLISGQYTYLADASPYAVETLRLNDGTYNTLQNSPQVIRVDRAAADAGGFDGAGALVTTEDSYYLSIPASFDPDVSFDENGEQRFGEDGAPLAANPADLARALGVDSGAFVSRSPLSAITFLSDPGLFESVNGKDDPSQNITLNGNLELRPVEGINLRLGGAFSDNENTSFSFTNSLFNRGIYNLNDNQTIRGYASLRQVLSSTAFYQLQAEYTNFEFVNYPEAFGNDLNDVINYGDIDNPVNAVANRYYSYNADESVYQRQSQDGQFATASAYGTFTSPGSAVVTYSQGNDELLRVFGTAQTQVGVHELSFGGEYEQTTSRRFSIGGFGTARTIGDIDEDGDGILECETPVGGEFANENGCVQAYNQLPFDYLDNRVSYFGYNYLGLDEVDEESISGFADGTNTDIAPYQPIYYGGYVRDRVEYRDLVIDLGLRLDVFDNNTQVLRDPFAFVDIYRASDAASGVVDPVTGEIINAVGSLPSTVEGDFAVYVDSNSDDVVGYRDLDGNFYDASGQEVASNEVTSVGRILAVNGGSSISEEAFVDYEPQLTIMPRIGVTFPVTNRALFFASYNVTSQRPSENAFATIRDYENVRSGQGTINNANLKPETTEQYELGFRQRLGERAAFTLSGFYRTQRNKITLRNVNISFPSETTTYTNQDFTTTKGVEAAFELRRTRNLSVNANYTLSFAEGTGSDSRTARIIAWRSQTGVFPETISPLDFDQRHNVNVSVDYRLGAGEGPMIGGIRPLEGFGFNLLGVFKSGNPYTQLDARAQQSPISNSTNGGIVGAVNSIRTPSTTRLDLRVDRSFNLGPARLRGFAWIQNLLDTDQIVGVYRTTGLVDDDGFLASEPAEITGLGSQAEQDAYRFLYSNYVGGPVVLNSYRASGGQLYGLPRRIRLGVTLDF
ncbi:MAG: TonB-dependent receptor [Bacteroidota bacterium]